MTRDDVSPTTTYRDSSSRPLCERLPSLQLLGADVMKSLLALTLAAALAVACSKTEQQQADSAPPPIIWRTAGVAAARITTARGDITGTSCRECSGTSTAEVCGTGEACAVVTRHLGVNASAPSPSAAPAPPQKPVEPPPPPPPAFKTVTVPAGTSLAVSVLSNLG